MFELLPVLKQSLTITLFVLSMMLIIEYLNIFSRGVWSKGLKSSPWKQVLIGALLGIIPGCLGAYTAVSLYVHNIFSTGALVATMIATSGDEAFVMFSVIPDTAIIIHIAIFIIAILAGFLVNAFWKKDTAKSEEMHFHVHDNEPDCICWDPKILLNQLKQITLLRLSLILILIGILVVVSISMFHNEHVINLTHQLEQNMEAGHDHLHPAWINITFMVVAGISFFVILTVNDHFLKEHLFKHIIKKHFARVLLWTFFTLLIIHGLSHYFNISDLIGNNLYIVLLIAILVGIIPESGPHFIFVLLFASGSLPLSILLASSIVQDGHGSLPLLAESRKSFFIIKGINVAVGLIVGFIGLTLGI